MFKKVFFGMCLAVMLTMVGCSPKKPTEVKTARELFDYSISALKADKTAPSEYVSLLKDASVLLADELDEELGNDGEGWTNFSDEKEISGAVFIVCLAVASVEDEKFEAKYENVDGDEFAKVLKNAFIEYAK